MRRVFPRALRAGALPALLLWAAGCVTGKPPAREPVREKAVPTAPTSAAPALDSAPSGVLYRVGLKSDLTSFVFGPPGARGRARGATKPAGQARYNRGKSLSLPGQAGPFPRGTAQSAWRALEDWQASGGRLSADRGVYRGFCQLPVPRERRRSREAAPDRTEASRWRAPPTAAARQRSRVRPEAKAPTVPSPVDIHPPIRCPRGSGRQAYGEASSRGQSARTITLVNRVDVEETSRVVPAEHGSEALRSSEGLRRRPWRRPIA